MRRPFVGTNGRSGPPPIRRLLWCEKRTGSSIVSPRELRLFTMRLGGRPVEKIVDDIMARLFASSVGLEGWPDRPHNVIMGANRVCGKATPEARASGAPGGLGHSLGYRKPPVHHDGKRHWFHRNGT